MKTEDKIFQGAVLRKMATQLRGVMDELENNSMISTTTRQKVRGEMEMQLGALEFGASEIERAYGKAPEIIQGQATESGVA